MTQHVSFIIMIIFVLEIIRKWQGGDIYWAFKHWDFGFQLFLYSLVHAFLFGWCNISMMGLYAYVELLRLHRLASLSGSYPGKPCITPPSCTKPPQPTINTLTQSWFNFNPFFSSKKRQFDLAYRLALTFFLLVAWLHS